MDKAFFERLFNTFSAEAEEHLSVMMTCLLKLENIPAPAINSPEIVEEVYREAHSLKGASRAVGLAPIEFLLQDVESYFSLVKKEEIEPDPSHYDVLLKALDLTKEYIDLKKRGEDGYDKEEEMRIHTEEIKIISSGGITQTLREKNEDSPDSGLPSRDDDSFQSFDHKIEQLRKKIRQKNQTPKPVPEPEESNREPDKSQDTLKKTDVLSPRNVPETIRLSTSKIDDLRTSTEELLNIKLNFDQLFSEIKQLGSEVDGKLKTVEETNEKLKRLAQIAETLPPHPREIILGIVENFNSLSDWSFKHNRRVNELASSVKKYKIASQRLISEVNDHSQTLLMLPFSYILDIIPKAMRDLARALRKETELLITGADIEVDRRILEELKDPLLHIIRNSIDHGIEFPSERLKKGKPKEGNISIDITGPVEGNIILTVSDDGRGLDVDTIYEKAVEKGFIEKEESGEIDETKVSDLIFQSGVTTAGVVTDISGRGLGMSIVKEKVEKLKGSVAVASERGKFFQVVIKLPVKISTTRGVRVTAGKFKFILESHYVEKIVRYNKSEIKYYGKGFGIIGDDELVPVKILKSDLGLDNSPLDRGVYPCIFLKARERRIALLVDEVSDELEIIIKPFQPPLDAIKKYTGASVLGDGRLYPVLSSAWLLGLEGITDADRSLLGERKERDILVVDDSKTSRTLLLEILEGAGFNVDTAEDGVEAYKMLTSKKYDALVSDIEMPNMNGLQLTEKVRTTPALASLPVILVTGLATEEDKARGTKAGANAYILKKSFDQSILIDTIKFFVEGRD